MKSAFVSAIDSWLKGQNKYTKSESNITFPDIQDALVLVSNNFSTQTSYENQTKKAINNKFIPVSYTHLEPNCPVRRSIPPEWSSPG